VKLPGSHNGAVHCKEELEAAGAIGEEIGQATHAALDVAPGSGWKVFSGQAVH
jgi:hypothetical protein